MGFRYTSIHHHDPRLQSLQALACKANSDDPTPGPADSISDPQPNRHTPLSDDGVLTPNEMHRRAKDIGLSPAAESLYCWEPPADNIAKGFSRGGDALLYTPVRGPPGRLSTRCGLLGVIVGLLRATDTCLAVFPAGAGALWVAGELIFASQHVVTH